MSTSYYAVKSVKEEIMIELMDRPIITPFDIPADGLAVGGLTLVFSTPGQTVTFSGSPGDKLTAQEMVGEINAAFSAEVSKVARFTPEGSQTEGIRLLLTRGASSLELTSAGTANTTMGYSNTTNTRQDPPADVASVVHTDLYFRAYCKA